MRGPYRRLRAELFLSLLAAFLVTATAYFAFNLSLSHYMTRVSEDKSFSSKKEALAVERIQEIIRSKQLALHEFPTLDQTLQEEHIWFWAISSDRENSDVFQNEDARKYFLSTYQYNTYSITFSDGPAQLHIISDYESTLYYKAQIVILIFCFLVFVLTFLAVISRKIKYLNHISQEIKAIEGGELNRPISIKGKDEITQLAENLNRMRLALQQKIEAEKKARTANRDLITALSHDLRTPLTSQLGYLEILKTHPFETEAQYAEYLNKCIANCEQIHQMSDRMFEYFLVSDDAPAEAELELTELDGRELLSQMILEKCLLLEEQGYRFDLHFPEEAFQLSVNVNYMFRIIENIFSNIEKYADPAEEIRFSLRQEGGSCLLCQSNPIREKQNAMQSTKIGLRSVAQMTQRQQGSVQTSIQNQVFRLCLRFPIVTDQQSPFPAE